MQYQSKLDTPTHYSHCFPCFTVSKLGMNTQGIKQWAKITFNEFQQLAFAPIWLVLWLCQSNTQYWFKMCWNYWIIYQKKPENAAVTCLLLFISVYINNQHTALYVMHFIQLHFRLQTSVQYLKVIFLHILFYLLLLSLCLTVSQTLKTNKESKLNASYRNNAP